jgi:hypothetical protein
MRTQPTFVLVLVFEEGRRLPHSVRDLLDPQQRAHRGGRRLVQIEAALDVGVALDLATVVEHRAAFLRFWRARAT